MSTRTAPRYACRKCPRTFVRQDRAVAHVQAAHPNRAGLVETRRARLTGTQVSIYDNRVAMFDDPTDDEMRYFLVCEDHSRLVGVPTLTDARGHLPTVSWCGVCHGTEQPDDDGAGA